DESVRDWATFGLGQLIERDTPKLRAALLVRLEDPDEKTRIEAVRGLARRGGRRPPGALRGLPGGPQRSGPGPGPGGAGRAAGGPGAGGGSGGERTHGARAACRRRAAPGPASSSGPLRVTNFRAARLYPSPEGAGAAGCGVGEGPVALEQGEKGPTHG